MLCFNLVYAGTPQINESFVLCGFILILIGLVAGTGYLIKFIKRKFIESELKNHEATSMDDSEVNKI